MTDTIDSTATESSLFFTAPEQAPEPSEAESQPEPTEAADTPPEGDPEADAGEAEAEVTQQHIDLGELGQHLVTVKVNGEEFDVPLEEAVKGFMRQDAFTRKTQALAEQAKNVQHLQALGQQLDRDPEGTVLRLAEVFKVQLPGSEDYEEPDPRDEKLSEIELKMQELEAARFEAHVAQEFKDLHAKYGDFDEEDLLAFAAERPGIQSLEDAYAIMNFGSLRQKTQETKQITDAKRTAQVVSSQGGTQRGAVASGQMEYKTTRDAIVAAMREGGWKV